MAVIKLKNVERFRDRYGKIRYYFRKGKGARFALQDEPGSDAFNNSYAAANGKANSVAYSKERTFNALATIYYRSTRFLGQKLTSQIATRNEIDRFCKEHGHRHPAQMTVEHVELIIGAKAHTPAAANTRLKHLRVLVRLAIRLKWRTDDPTIDVQKFKEGTHHTWTEKEIAQYEERWPLGCLERVAFDLHLYTGQRRGDVAAMQPSDIDGYLISVAQEKGDGEANDEKLVIPMHRNLIASLNVWHGVGQTLIAKKNGDRYTVESYGNLMAAAIEKAGLPVRCVLHGLRKAAARRLAEAGCSASMIQAITGHKSLKEVERYVKAANQGLLAVQAIDSLGKFKKA